jgi:uncharacterized membrane protein
MKHCQTCNRLYPDDSLTYCLNDGSVLVVAPHPEETMVPGTILPRAPARNRNLRSLVSSPRWILFPAILLLSLLVGASAGWFIYEFQNNRPLRSSGLSNTPTPASNSEASGSATNAPSSTDAGQAISREEPEDIGKQYLTGTWTVVNTVRETSYQPFVNLRIGYRLIISQNGSNFTAEGEKLSENGRVLPMTRRTAIHLSGALEGESIVASFVEKGTRRQTNGRFVWKLDRERTLMKGTFVSTAANSSGTSVATRER